MHMRSDWWVKKIGCVPIWKSGCSTSGFTSNCSMGCMATGLVLLNVRFRRGRSRHLRIQFRRCAHHIADTRRCAQHHEHTHQPRFGVNSEMAEEPVQSPSDASADDKTRDQFCCEPESDSALCWR